MNCAKSELQITLNKIIFKLGMKIGSLVEALKYVLFKKVYGLTM